MTDIKVVNRKDTWVPDATVAVKRESAFLMIRTALAMTDLYPTHHHEQLSLALWKWTEGLGVSPHPKYNIPYISAGVLHGESPTPVNHEHVGTRKELRQELLSRRWSDDELRTFLEQEAVACIVTVEEHAALGASKKKGWQRYVDAGIAVWDRGAQRWLDLADGRSLAPREVVANAGLEIRRGNDLADDVQGLIAAQAKPDKAALLRRLVRTARFATAVSVPACTRAGDVQKYFRIHDALIEEPTRTVAYAHWSGKVDLALRPDDVPSGPLDGLWTIRTDKTYGVSCRIVDEQTLAAAEELLSLALQNLRQGVSAEA